MNTPNQAALFAQMAQPGFYPHPVDAVVQRETHISKVFLTGDVVYKIKKPLNLEFLDFTTLEKRHHFCLQELTLNRRLTRNVYLDVVPITFKDGRFNMAGQGEVVEYAVKMRRLSESTSMTQLLREGKLTGTDIENLASLLTDFYGQASPETGSLTSGIWETVCNNFEENFRQMGIFSGRLFDDRLFQIVSSAARSFLHRRKQLFDDRARDRKIRDCHGDLKTGHVYFTDDGIQIIDCIEFNERFRFQDIASDLAFLAMDIDFEGYPELGEILINGYVRRTKDSDIFVLLDFYKCYRAAVRCKVNCIRIGEGDLSDVEKDQLISETGKYLDLAYRYAVRFTRPTLWVVCGLPASGKSTVAETLAATFRIRVIQSDRVRKQMFGVGEQTETIVPPETALYSREASAVTYGRMLILAQEEIEQGRSVILDATFGSAHFRAEAVRLAKDMDANLVFVECVVPDDVLKERLLKRETTGSVSDARIGHFDYFKHRFEPLEELGDVRHIRVDTARPMAECMATILANG